MTGMFDDIFEDTDFGNIDAKEENELVNDAKDKDMWHSGKKPDIWSVNYDDMVWDMDLLDGDDEEESDQVLIPHSNGSFGDLF